MNYFELRSINQNLIDEWSFKNQLNTNDIFNMKSDELAKASKQIYEAYNFIMDNVEECLNLMLYS